MDMVCSVKKKIGKRIIIHNGIQVSETEPYYKKAIQPFIFRGCPKTFSKRHIVLIQNGRMVLLGPSFLRLKLNMRLDFLFWKLNCHDKKLLLKGEDYSQKDVKSTEMVAFFIFFGLKL